MSKSGILAAGAATALMALGAGAAQAQAQERTVASANQFLELVSNRGTSKVGIYQIDNLTADECVTEIDGHFMSDGRRLNGAIRINWGEVSRAWYPYISATEINVMGAISKEDSSGRTQIDSSIVFRYESKNTAERVAAAFEFLMDSCDQSRGLGF